MIDLFQERLTNEVHAFFWSLSCLQGAYGNERCNQFSRDNFICYIAAEVERRTKRNGIVKG